MSKKPTKKPAPERLRLEYLPIGDLVEWKGNPKDHDIDSLLLAFERFGFVSPIIEDKTTGRVVAGHGRIEGLKLRKESGAPPPRFIETDPDGAWLAPVIRGIAFANKDEAAAYLLADNQIQVAGGLNEDKARALLSRLSKRSVNLDGLGFSMAALSVLTKPKKSSRAKPRLQPDSLPTEPPEPVTKIGDVWELGDHLVACMDSTKKDQVESVLPGESAAMVITDPPYAIYGSSTGVASDITDDGMVRPFFEEVLRASWRAVPWFGHVFVFCDWRSWPSWWDCSKVATLTPKNLLVWDKGDGGLGSNFLNCHELTGFFMKIPPHGSMGNGPAGQRGVARSNMLRFPRVTGQERKHNAQKPVELLRVLLAASSEPGDTVADFFCGSGSTLIACEMDGRRCVTFEKLPAQVDAAVLRWETFTGQKARLRGS